MFWHISFSWKALAKMTWICKYVWAALKHHLWRHLLFSKIWFDDDDKSNDNSCYCSGNCEYFVISSFTSLFYCILFLCLPAAYYFTYIFLFILRPPLHWNSWWCPHGLIYPQVHSHTTHDFFLYCLGQIDSSFPQVQCQWNKVTSTDLCNYRKSRALISIMPWYIFFFQNVFLITYLYLQFPLLFLCTSFYKPGFFTFSSHHCGLSDLDSCAETGDFGILL